MDHPLFEIVKTTTGVTSIRNKQVGEIMHNPVGPWLESNRLYIEQSRLKDRLKMAEPEDLVLFDVGLGAAANALAALHCVAGASGSRRLKMISFEREMDLLQFALDHADQFEHFAGFEDALRSILTKGHWESPRVSWELRRGDFVEMIQNESERPHVIFFDPYSPQVNIDMWTRSNFVNLHKLCRSEHAGGTVLFTYSRATPIRVALLCAGFFVGAGVSIGMKKETTQASTIFGELAAPLQTRWIERWNASHTPWPLGSSESEHAEIRELILKHPQFTS